MSDPRRDALRRRARELEGLADEARDLARALGLDGVPVNYWLVDYDEMNELIAYDGFQTRYPHWRWGMKYERQRKEDRYGAGKAFEIVINDDPAHAYLQESNSTADQKAVITHVEAHADFFANNRWYARFDDRTDAAALLEAHARRIESYMDDPEIGREAVERWIDTVLPLTDTIDQHRAFERAPGDSTDADDGTERRPPVGDLDISADVEGAIFDDEWLEAYEDVEVGDEPARDVLAFLRRHGMQYDEEAGKAAEMDEWQQDVIDMLRTEAYYFAPQKMTKVMNEGWACVAPDTLVFTTEGLVPMKEVVDRHVPVSDGEREKDVYDSNIITDHDTVTIKTRRGFELTGSNNHRIRRPDGSWVRLDQLAVGDEVAVSGGNDVWPTERVTLDWQPPEHVTLHDVAEDADVSVWTVMRYRETGRAERADAIQAALANYDAETQGVSARTPIDVPREVTEALGRFLGLLIGDGHVSSNSRHVGFTTGTEEYAREFADLTEELFGVEPTVQRQGSRWRVYACSEHLKDLLVEGFGLPQGKASERKSVPDQILRSPKSVVVEFVRGLLDADGHAGDQGVILSTKSERVSQIVHLLLVNFGVISRREQTDGCYHVHVTGQSARRFAEVIGFGYPEKQARLREYLDDRSWFETESWTDEIVDIERQTGDVYDISVEDTHRYAAAGFLNHNSYWESIMMAEEAFAGDDEFIDYAEHLAEVLGSPGLNPYALGKRLWEHIENTANRREVVERLLCVDGVTWRNFHDAVDFDRIQELLEPTPPLDSITAETLPDLRDLDPAKVDPGALDRALDGEIDVEHTPWAVLSYEGMAERHFSLTEPRNRGFLRGIDREELERIDRYLVDDDRYPDVEAAIADVEYTRGWDRLYEIRESHNDVTFLDEFLTPEFVRDADYFTYEYSHAADEFRVASTDPEDVKKKLLVQFTNFGKPTIVVADGNYDNRNELLLSHQYNGIDLDLEAARRTLERVFDLWGRPVNLRTIVTEVEERDREVARRRGREPEAVERGKRLRYDGESHEVHDLDPGAVESIAASDVDYDTTPDEWLQ